MSGRLDGKIAFVTGAAQGIGAACARLFLEEGAAAVYAADLKAEGLAALAGALGPKCVPVTLDVGDPAAWDAAMMQVGRDHGQLDVLVNNAAISVGATLADETFEGWRATQTINLDGVFLGCKAALHLLAKSHAAAIVNVGSALGVRAQPAYPAYGAAKAGVVQLTKSIAVYCGRAGLPIRANAVLPGSVMTPMVEKSLGDTEESRAAGLAARARVHPIGRIGEPHEIAEAIAFLASDAASFITGAELAVDGGLTI